LQIDVGRGVFFASFSLCPVQTHTQCTRNYYYYYYHYFASFPTENHRTGTIHFTQRVHNTVVVVGGSGGDDDDDYDDDDDDNNNSGVPRRRTVSVDR